MADTAAFFAKKKKKKKAFKFNANKVDVESVKSAVHVDAPALSSIETGVGDSSNLVSGVGGGDASSASGTGGVDSSKGNEQWDDEAYTSSRTKKVTAAPMTSSSTGTTELLDMKALDPKRNNQNNIKEKLRVNENKALLANARKGMEREAQRIKDEKKGIVPKVKPVVASRFAGAAANVGGGGSASGGALGATGGKWVPPHMRGGGGGGGMGGGGLSRVRMGASASLMSQKLDTQDESLFPDLASAATIIEKQQQFQQPAYMAPKKTPVGGGATWASKSLKKKTAPIVKSKPSLSTTTSLSSSKSAAAAPAPETAQEKTPEPVVAVAAAKKAEPASVVDKEKTATAAASKPVKKTKTKKKKKDLSTFKPA